MRWARAASILAPVLAAGCAHEPDRHTLAQLRNVQFEVKEVQVDEGLDKAMESYRRFLEETPRAAMTPEAMRRLADLQIEKEFGILGDGKLIELPAPQEEPAQIAADSAAPARPKAAGIADLSEAEKDFERRATAHDAIAPAGDALAMTAPGGTTVQPPAGPVEAIALYDRLLAEYPTYEHNDKVLYQKARAYDELGRTEEAMRTMERLIAEHPHSRYIDEVQFRRAEYFFTRRKYRHAEDAYSAIVGIGARSEYYELALYKLGWTLYKQEFYDEALHKYIALLDHKVSVGYDFDQAHGEEDERRIADTFRVISLSFSNLGGPEVVSEYFAAQGHRGYEDRVYGNLGEFYLTKLRYHDAAAAYKAFVELNPFHKASPHFGMRIVEIYAQGGFQKLVLESKKEFANRYGLKADYWRHFSVEDSPEVLSYLKSNLKDLANHYHAQYQQAERAEEKPAYYGEALLWYRNYLASFPKDSDTPPIHYQMADLLMEHQDFGLAAKEYERIAYDYPSHDRASAAGYAAIYAHRQNLKAASDENQATVKREVIASSLRFADAFSQHEHAPAVLGAAADDLYALKDFRPAIASAQKLIERYPGAGLEIRRSAWTVVAHSSFDLAEYPQAEHAYTRVLELTPATDDQRQALTDNLAASIYKQGEQANELQDYRAAANHFLRIRQVAPTSQIRAAAEYDAGAALIRLADWAAAAEVLEGFRRTYPEHELLREATKQIAFVYRQHGQLARAAGEYERVAAESDDPQLRGEALLVAADLYQQSNDNERALSAYVRYVEEFPRPAETAVETRFKIAEIYKASRDAARYYEELQKIVRIDAESGAERTGRIRYLAARSALALTERLYDQFAQVRLVQPFDLSLQEKKQRMDAVIQALDGLLGYEVGEVTAAATFYMAEVYYGFNRSLLESERPGDLAAADLQEYELALEEEAFPFEERAIEVHEKNLELIRAGIYNSWIDKSLDRLATLMPARYAKQEVSSGFLGSIDRYAYRTPAAQGNGIGASESGDATQVEAPARDVASNTDAVAAGVANAIVH